MWSGFGGSLSFELMDEMEVADGKCGTDGAAEVKVRIKHEYVDNGFVEGELGDSCCFGTRTVRIGEDCIWKLHGGV